jgi:hypothetical protein
MHSCLIRTALILGLAGLIPTARAADYYIANRDVAGLVGAMNHANQSAQADAIHLAEGGLYALSGEAESGLALPTVHGQLQLLGHGAEIRRNSGEPMALLEVAAGAELDIDSLTLAEGSRGAVRNHGILRLQRSAIVDGTTQSENAIVQNFGHFEARHSTIGFNQVAGAGRDAAIVVNFGSMRLEHCRVAGNSLARRYPTLAAAPLLNYGELALDALALEDNEIIDGFDGLSSSAVLNLGIGRTAATDLPPRPR